MALVVQLAAILWTILRQLLTPGPETETSMKFALVSFLVYGVGATLTCALLPLFGEYRFLESTSYTSVIWTTFAVWFIFHQLQKQNRSLMELDVMKKELINHVTHEFRTPLDTISSAVEIIEDALDGKNQKLRDYAGMMKSNLTRLSHFIDELLNLAAIQQARVRLEKGDVELSALAQRIIARLKPLADKNRTALSLKSLPVQLICDEEKMEQVISNLISNAIKASPGGNVTISIQTKDEKIEASVTDDGVGISPEHINHLFSSFYRIAIKSSSQRGSGLGLAIAKGWVEAHGGEIHAESDGPGKGSRFWFTLPKA
jgi:signal transduction histidine kinase